MHHTSRPSFAPVRRIIVAALSLACAFTLALPSGIALAASRVDAIVSSMTLDEKLSQMIVVALRSWDGQNTTDLTAAPELAAALQRHQYGGVILFAQNIVSSEQTARLTSALQANNNAIQGASAHIPYLMAVDEEGGVVVRFTMGTRMTGSMAVGATGENAEANAQATGRVLGEESAALGFNVDFAPSVDVNSNPANPVIGVRSFSDDPAKVGTLGIAFARGLSQSNVIGSYKHFPGHGDTGTDSHLGTATVSKTHDELMACELVPFKQAIEAGADLIMTAHITLPNYDDQVTFADGTQGTYPATMSHKVITELLRGELGYNGVVITDALEMDAIGKTRLVPGEEGSAEYAANIAEKVINAGVDILLIPADLKSASAAEFYDAYLDELARKVALGAISEQRVNESVTRILNLKEKYGLLDAYDVPEDVDAKVERAKEVVGSQEHHETETAIAREAITLLKNDGTLPLAGAGKRIVLVSRDKADNVILAYAVSHMADAGMLGGSVRVENLAVPESSTGPLDAETVVTIDYSYETSGTASPHVTDELAQAIADADVVVGFTKNWGVSALQPNNPQYQGASRVMELAKEAGAQFVLVSENLPYDVARYQDANAILCCYMSSGTDVDPTSRSDGSTTLGAYNANAVEVVGALFGLPVPKGTLPVSIPAVKVEGETVSYDPDKTLYERGFGLSYGVEKSGWVEEGGTWRYYEDGKARVGWLYDSAYGAYFWLDDAGDMATGWRWIDGDWFFFGTSGRMKCGWAWSTEYAGWYYFNEDPGVRQGAMLRNTAAKDGSKVGPDGRWVVEG